MGSTKVVTALAEGDASEAASQIADQLLAGLGGEAPKLVLFFASTKQPVAELAPALTARFADAVVLGSSTAGEFTQSERNRKGTVVAVAVGGRYRVEAGIGTGLGADPEAAVRGALEGIGSEEDPELPHRTAVLLLDPLAGKSEEATLLAGAFLGEGVPLAGGAAGDDLAMKETFVSCDARHASDAVVIAIIRSAEPLGLGVNHGHTPVSDELSVTSADGATIHTIDDRPAWDVWVERTKEAAAAVGIDPTKLKDDEVGAYLLQYEAGLANGSEYKIRAPLSRGKDGSLSFACAVPEGAQIRITESVAERQIDSAREAARRAVARLDGRKVAGAVVFDCICRNLILGDRFSDAVAAVGEELGSVPLAGFETYGEIALDVGDMSGFHNTTTVVLAFPE